MTHSKRSISKALVSLPKNNLSTTEPILFLISCSWPWGVFKYTQCIPEVWGVVGSWADCPFLPTDFTTFAHSILWPLTPEEGSTRGHNCHVSWGERNRLKPALPMSTAGLWTLGAKIMIEFRIRLNWWGGICHCSTLGVFSDKTSTLDSVSCFSCPFSPKINKQ